MAQEVASQSGKGSLIHWSKTIDPCWLQFPQLPQFRFYGTSSWENELELHYTGIVVIFMAAAIKRTNQEQRRPRCAVRGMKQVSAGQCTCHRTAAKGTIWDDLVDGGCLSRATWERDTLLFRVIQRTTTFYGTFNTFPEETQCFCVASQHLMALRCDETCGHGMLSKCRLAVVDIHPLLSGH